MTHGDARADAERDEIRARHVDEVGLKAIEIYELQKAEVGKLWSYFSHYSTILFLMTFGVRVFWRILTTAMIGRWWLAPPVFYVIFVVANLKGLGAQLDDLKQYHCVATNLTGLNLRAERKGLSLLLMAVFAVILLVVYVAAVWSLLKSK